jgi:hypothetical protein
MGQKILFLKNEPEKLLKTQGKTTQLVENEPENEAEKLLKTLEGWKNEAGHVVENKKSSKKRTENEPENGTANN